jgi:DNA-directed RNA polymerase specialized sigma24 family protein
VSPAVPTPPRPSRAGARRGKLSPELVTALRDEAKRLWQAGEPVEVVKAVGDAFAALDRELERIAAIRLDAVRTLRKQGCSYARIASATELSISRVQQLVHDPRARR